MPVLFPFREIQCITYGKHMDNRTLPGVGHIQFLNCLPLYYMLLKNNAVSGIRLFRDTPTGLCRRLVSGALDISPIPAIEYARHSDQLLLLPDISVSSNGSIMSILIVSTCPLEELDGKPFALTNTSRTSQTLTKIILREKYGINPVFFETAPVLSDMLQQADAALLIGDDALKVYAAPGGYSLFDLGELWKALTGKSMVYAVWAVRREFAEKNSGSVKRVYHAFKQSMEMSIKGMDEICKDIADSHSFSPEFLRQYFVKLQFSFDSGYREGLMLFFEKARAAGDIERVPELLFADI